MKKMTLLFLSLMAMSAAADIPDGRYLLEKIECSTGKVLKQGGKFVTYQLFLDINAPVMKMTALAKSGSWAPFKLDCTQINEGSFIYTQEGKYEGDLPNTSVKCNADAWTNILKKRLFGVEEFGTFDYELNGDKLTISNPNTVTKYSCEETGGYPIYHYNRN